MKITLVQPPNMQRTGKWKLQKARRTPTNLALLAAYVRRHGHEPRIVDLDVDGGTLDEIVRLILDGQPRLIGFTCLTPRFPIALELAARCRQLAPATVIVAGGPHVSGLARFALDDAAIDYAIAGEGEEAFLELVQALAAGQPVNSIANLVYRDGAAVRCNPPRPLLADLDALPFPAWDLLKLDRYVDAELFHGPHLGLMTGRGCPHACYFCASRVIWGRHARLRSPASVVGEIEEAVSKFHIREFMFYDDTFTLRRDYVVALCELLAQRRLDVRFYVQARVDTIDVELVRMLKTAGCFAVAVGVESGNAEILRTMGKQLTREQIRAGCRILKEAHMPFVASYIIGHPGDTHATIRETIAFADELDADQAKFLIATPYPGTQAFALAVERGLISAQGAADLGEHSFFQHIAANLSAVSDEDLLRYQQEAYDNYDLRKRPLR